MPEDTSVIKEAKEETSPPIAVSNSLIDDQLMAALRVIGVLIGGIVTMLGFLKTKDIAGLINFIRSEQFIPISAAAVTVGTFIWSQYRTRMNKAEKIVLADAVDSKVGFVKQKK